MKLFAPMLMAVAAAAALPVHAQDNTNWDKIVLENASGSVMTSTGGEYQTAAAGKALVVGENMMVAGSSTAKVVYYDLDDQGKVIRTCERDYTRANTYVIDATCTAATAWSGKGALLIAGAAVIGTAIINGGGDEDAPISTGARR